MAIEIMEFTIKASVDTRDSSRKDKPQPGSGMDLGKRESIVKECMYQVMQTLKSKNHR